MKKKLPTLIAGAVASIFLMNVLHAQIKGNPQLQGKVQQPSLQKISTKLSPGLQVLHDNTSFKIQNKSALSSDTKTDALQKYLQIKGDKVLVNFTIKDSAAATRVQLQKMGIIITGVYGRVISGFVPIAILPQLEAIRGIRFVKASYKPLHQSIKNSFSANMVSRVAGASFPKFTPVISQGDTAALSYLARKKFNVNGKGVKVGIISDSYNNLGTAPIGVEQGELPGKNNPFGFKKSVQVIKDLDGGGTDEGRAMAEIVHDVAPAAQLAFYTADFGEADFAQGIQTLADYGCEVINDDVYYFDEPFFQDGIIAQSVDAVKKRGITYFSAAGNQYNNSYESNYRPSNVAYFGAGNGTAHNFSAPGNPSRYAQPLYVPPTGSIILSLQWDQSSFAASGVGATTDFDVYLTDIFGNIVAYSASDNIKSGEPVEIFGFQNNTKNYTFFLTIVKFAGPEVSKLKYILYNDAQFYITKVPIPGIFAPSLVGHAKAAGAIAMGASFYFNTPPYGVDTPKINWYSALGGVPDYFDINGKRINPSLRKKPTIVGPDGVNTSFFDPFGNGDISQDADKYPNFFGTSAAAPHAAGVAALMIDAERLHHITPDQIQGILSATATDMDNIYTDGFDKGFDFNTGYGFMNAEKAVGKVRYPNKYICDLKLDPLCSEDPKTKRNWVINNPNPFPMDVEYFVEGAHQFDCLAVQPGYTNFSTLTISNSNCARSNIAVLTWKDNFEVPHFDVAYSTKAKCGVNKLSKENSDETTRALQDFSVPETAADNLAEVYPNPSANTFKVYLSLTNQQAVSIDIYSLDGKKLQSKIVNQSKGITEMDAANFKLGVYLMNIQQGTFNKTIKVVKL